MRKGVSGSLQEEHGVFHPGKVVGPVYARHAEGVERKPQEDQPSNALKRLLCGRPRRHSTPQGLAPPRTKGARRFSPKRTEERTGPSPPARSEGWGTASFPPRKEAGSVGARSRALPDLQRWLPATGGASPCPRRERGRRAPVPSGDEGGSQSRWSWSPRRRTGPPPASLGEGKWEG